MVCPRCSRQRWPSDRTPCTFPPEVRVFEVSHDRLTWVRLPPGVSIRRYRYERAVYVPKLWSVPTAAVEK